MTGGIERCLTLISIAAWKKVLLTTFLCTHSLCRHLKLRSGRPDGLRNPEMVGTELHVYSGTLISTSNGCKDVAASVVLVGGDSISSAKSCFCWNILW